MKKIMLLLFLGICIQSTSLAVSWEEDTDGDGRKETKFYDDDGDGNPDNASVDKDGDGKYEEYWVDADDDGVWDRMWWDSDGDGVWDKGRFDNDEDGDWDDEWTDHNKNGKVDGNGGERRAINVPVAGPRPVVAVAQREECNCAEKLPEPEIIAASTGNYYLWGGLGVVLIAILLFLILRSKKRTSV